VLQYILRFVLLLALVPLAALGTPSGRERT